MFRSEEARLRYLSAYERAMAQCPTPAETLDVPTAHGTTRVYRWGTADATPMVLLHGMMATSAAWWPFLPAFAEQHPVYAIDTLGEANLSVATAPIRDTATRTAWLHDVLAELGLDGVHLVGGSTGGWHAANQAIHRPERLTSVTLLDPTAVSAPFSPAVMLRAVGAVVTGRWDRWLRWATGVERVDTPDFQVVLSGIREFRATQQRQTLIPAQDLSRVDLPLLALFGGKAKVHDAARAARTLRERVPHAQVEVWPEMGHDLSPHRERVERLVLGFTGTSASAR